MAHGAASAASNGKRPDRARWFRPPKQRRYREFYNRRREPLAT